MVVIGLLACLHVKAGLVLVVRVLGDHTDMPAGELFDQALGQQAFPRCGGPGDANKNCFLYHDECISRTRNAAIVTNWHAERHTPLQCVSAHIDSSALLQWPHKK